MSFFVIEVLPSQFQEMILMNLDLILMIILFIMTQEIMYD